MAWKPDKIFAKQAVSFKGALPLDPTCWKTLHPPPPPPLWLDPRLTTGLERKLHRRGKQSCVNRRDSGTVQFYIKHNCFHAIVDSKCIINMRQLCISQACMYIHVQYY